MIRQNRSATVILARCRRWWCRCSRTSAEGVGNELGAVIAADEHRRRVDAGELLQHRHNILGPAAPAHPDRQAEAAVLVDHIQELSKSSARSASETCRRAAASASAWAWWSLRSIASAMTSLPVCTNDGTFRPLAACPALGAAGPTARARAIHRGISDHVIAMEVTVTFRVFPWHRHHPGVCGHPSWRKGTRGSQPAGMAYPVGAEPQGQSTLPWPAALQAWKQRFWLSSTRGR